mmetsp:Transcript_4401/g.11418  ORF Transcript_4401/g.11418 Transcript_4401/m.11418 type:complete len:233 (+) Transcript_4401:382-1080(+)
MYRWNTFQIDTKNNPKTTDAYLELSSVEVLCGSRKLFKINVRMDIHLSRVNLQNARTGVLLRGRKFNFSVQPSRSHQCGVQNVGPVRRSNHLEIIIIIRGPNDRGQKSVATEPKHRTHAYLHFLVATESVELVQKLQHSPLHLSIAAQLRIEALCADGIDFVNEYDTRRLFLCESKGVPHKLGTISYEHLDQLGASQFQKCRIGLSCTGSSYEGFTGAGRAVQQDALWRFDA